MSLAHAPCTPPTNDSAKGSTELDRETSSSDTNILKDDFEMAASPLGLDFDEDEGVSGNMTGNASTSTDFSVHSSSSSVTQTRPSIDSGTDEGASGSRSLHDLKWITRDRTGRPALPMRLRPPPLKTKIVRAALWSLFWCIMSALPSITLTVLVPVINFFTIPWFFILNATLLLLSPCLAYLSLSQAEPPEGASLPFLPSIWDWKLYLQVNAVIINWIIAASYSVPPVIVDWCVRRVIGAREKDRDGRMIQRDIKYGSNSAKNKLDIYRARTNYEGEIGHDALSQAIDHFTKERLGRPRARKPLALMDSPNPTRRASPSSFSSHSSSKLAPVIIFIPSPHLGPISQRKWMYESLGRNLAAVGYTVVIADVTQYPEGRAKEMVGDVRKVMSWAERNVGEWGGDSGRIWLMGHSLGGHLALLTILQDVVVESRESILAEEGEDAELDMSNGLRKLKVYEPNVKIPRISGLVLLAPICDVNEQIIQEARRGAAHISKLRRILGPAHTTAMFHSPAHVLHASRNVVNVALLPPKVLFIHGGRDMEVHHSQSEMMKELLRGVGVADVKCRIYPATHVEVVTALMAKMEEECSAHILDELTTLIPP